jgi:3-oxoacyl-[acyl-carrier-protein] synthase-3
LARYAQIVGWGMYVPDEILTNDDLASMIDTSDDWIRARTGIAERRIAAPKETTATMAVRAARAALRVANANPARLDLIIVATATPDYFFPATACLVQDALGATKAGAFDLSAGCTSFVYGLAVGSQMIISGAYDQVLVIGAETLSRIINWTDRNTCVLFGDGAGAVLLQASDVPGGVLSAVLGADGSGGDLLMIPAGGSRHPASAETVAQDLHYIYMNGRKVFRFATQVTAKAARQALAEANVNLEDISLFIPHQANGRIIQSAAKSLKLPPEKVFVNLDRYGNTSSASVPIALCEAIEQDRVKRGDHLVIVGFGAGLTWAAVVIRWGVPLPVPQPSRWRVAWRLARYRWATIRSYLRRLGRKVLSVVIGLFVTDDGSG